MRSAKEMFYIMDRCINRFQMLSLANRYPVESILRPPTDIFDMGDHLLVRVEMAGIDPNDVSITINGKLLTIKGSRNEDESSKMRVVQMEIMYGYFKRELILPSYVDAKKASAEYYNGMLEIELPKIEIQQDYLKKIVVMIR